MLPEWCRVEEEEEGGDIEPGGAGVRSLIVVTTEARSTRIEITRLGETILRPVALGITTRVSLGHGEEAGGEVEAGSKIAGRSPPVRMIETISRASIRRISITAANHAISEQPRRVCRGLITEDAELGLGQCG